MTRPRIPEVVRSPAQFKAEKDHIVAVIDLGQSSIGIRFESPEQLIEFCTQMMEKASIVWPENELVKEYLS